MATNPQKARIFLGVDGGGTKTSAWIASAKIVPSSPIPADETAWNGGIATGKAVLPSRLVLDRVLGQGEAGPGNPKPIGFEQVFLNLSCAIEQALAQADLQGGLSAISGACFGLAGVGRPEEKETVLSWLREQGCDGNWIVTDDIEPIRWAAQEECRQENLLQFSSANPSPDTLFGDVSLWENAVSLIAGTGSISQGQIESGDTFRAGGWGYMLGDEGSGFAIALAGLQSICQTYDQRDELSGWQQEILDHLQLPTPEHLIGWIYQVPIPRRQLANLAEIVISHRHSDPVAAQIAADSVMAWRDLVVLCCKKIGLKRGFGLAITGGIPNNAPDLVQTLLTELRLAEIEPANHRLVSTPVLGCLALAIDRFR